MNVKNSKSGNMRSMGETTGLNIGTYASEKRRRTRCTADVASYIGMSYPLQMSYGNLSDYNKKVEVGN